MPHAVAQMEEERKGPAEQQQQTEPGAEERLRRREGGVASPSATPVRRWLIESTEVSCGL